MKHVSLLFFALTITKPTFATLDKKDNRSKAIEEDHSYQNQPQLKKPQSDRRRLNTATQQLNKEYKK